MENMILEMLTLYFLIPVLGIFVLLMAIGSSEYLNSIMRPDKNQITNTAGGNSVNLCNKEVEELVKYKEYHEFAESQIEEVIGEFKTMGDLSAGLKKLKDERDRWRHSLLSLTPGGSEFADDPEMCSEFINSKFKRLRILAIEAKKVNENE